MTSPEAIEAYALAHVRSTGDDRLNNGRVEQSGRVAHLVDPPLAGRDLAQNAAHDLAGTGLRELRHDLDMVRRGDRTDLRPYVTREHLLDLVRDLDATLEDDVRVDA